MVKIFCWGHFPLDRGWHLHFALLGWSSCQASFHCGFEHGGRHFRGMREDLAHSEAITQKFRHCFPTILIPGRRASFCSAVAQMSNRGEILHLSWSMKNFRPSQIQHISQTKKMFNAPRKVRMEQFIYVFIFYSFCLLPILLCTSLASISRRAI